MDPPGTKLSPHTTKRRYQAISRLQGELCTAQSTNKPSRENFVPHTGPPPGQNSPHTKLRRAEPVQNSPSRRPRWTHPVQNSPSRRPSSVPHSGVTVWWPARLIWVRSPCDPSRKLSTSDSKRFGGTTMTAPHIITPAGMLGQALSQASPDLMRSLLQHVINALLSADADTVCGTQWNSLAARPGTRTRIIPSQE